MYVAGQVQVNSDPELPEQVPEFRQVEKLVAQAEQGFGADA